MINNISDAALKLAQLLNTEKEYDRAIPNYELYLKDQSQDFGVWSSLGWTYYSAGEMEASEETFKYLIEQNLDQPAYYYGLAVVYSNYHVKEYDKAQEVLEQALGLNPTEALRALIEKQLSYIKKQK